MRAQLRKQKKLRGIKLKTLEKLTKTERMFYARHDPNGYLVERKKEAGEQ